MTFKEISMLVRNHDQPQHILDEAAYRKLLQPLSPKEEAILVSTGATPALINALRSPSLLATSEMAAAFNNKQIQTQSNSPAVPQSEVKSPPLALIPPPLPVGDHFSAALEAAKTALPIAIQPDYAYSLSQLDQAKARARAEMKPLGFIMMWGQFFDKKSDTRAGGSEAAFAHFYQAFHSTLVLVFVRHETELSQAPAAVKQGFNGPDEGGFAPNMAVVDADASELIVEIPMAIGGKAGDGVARDAIFKNGAEKIDEWLASHPTASASLK